MRVYATNQRFLARQLESFDDIVSKPSGKKKKIKRNNFLLDLAISNTEVPLLFTKRYCSVAINFQWTRKCGSHIMQCWAI